MSPSRFEVGGGDAAGVSQFRQWGWGLQGAVAVAEQQFDHALGAVPDGGRHIEFAVVVEIGHGKFYRALAGGLESRQFEGSIATTQAGSLRPDPG